MSDGCENPIFLIVDPIEPQLREAAENMNERRTAPIKIAKLFERVTGAPLKFFSETAQYPSWPLYHQLFQ
jgi:hypothetical protein